MAMTLLTNNDTEIKKMVVGIMNRIGGSMPEIVVLDAIHESYRRICETTEAWVLTTHQTVSASNCLYDATGEYEVNIRRILSVKLRKKGQTMPFEYVPAVDASYYDLTQNGVYFFDPKRIEIFDEGVIQIVSSIIPKRANVYIDAEMYETYANAIIYGAIAELTTQINRPWYSEQMYMFYKNRFDEELTHIMANSATMNKTTSDSFSG